MKFFTLFSLVIICIGFASAEDKCDYANFKECISNIRGIFGTGIGGKTAESQCPTSVCDNVRDDYADCLEETWKSNKDYSDSFSQGVGAFLDTLALGDSIICEKEGGKYCYDEYKRRFGNATLMEEFYCTKCGKKMSENLRTIRLSTLDKNAEDYKQRKEEIENFSLCNGAFANASVKIASVLLISLISAFFML